MYEKQWHTEFMIDYTYPLFRPPAEADNLILQVTHGCSWNKCSFCSMYKTKKYSIKSLQDIFCDINKFQFYYPKATKVFLADGDALALDTKYLLEILKYLVKTFPKLRRVSTYASTQNILSKSLEDLRLLKEHKLSLFYYGIETGDDILLKKINKGVDSQQIIRSLEMVNQAKIKISTTIILGLGGEEYSTDHIRNTAKLISQVDINYLSTLQLGLEEAEQKSFYEGFEIFTHLDDLQILQEQKLLLETIQSKSKIIFRSNHASNALHLSGTLPKDTSRLISEINEALKMGSDVLVPEFYRGF